MSNQKIDLIDVKFCPIAENSGVTNCLNELAHLNDPYHLDDFRYFYDLDYLNDLYDLEIQQECKSSDKIEIKWVSPIEIDALEVSFYIKSLIVYGPHVCENRLKKLSYVVIELLKAQHTPEEVAFVLLNEEWAIGREISNRHKGAKLKFIEGVINSVKEELKIEQANMELEMLMEDLDVNGWTFHDDTPENKFSNVYVRKSGIEIHMSISRTQS
ncbi:hypothetical protein [Solibacillus cecembensis]|uniref:hypothetical protein n=1 Tax=Solibacillus cecembensis TaxID=459347 RepID=UPI003D051FB8